MSAEAQKFADRLAIQRPQTQADPSQWQPGGNLTFERATITNVNTTYLAVSGNNPNTCSIVIKGVTKYSVPWINNPPVAGSQVLVASQPPLLYVVGPSSTGNQVAEASNDDIYSTVGQWIAIGSDEGAPAFNAGWAAYTGSGFGTPEPPAYRQEGDWVHIRGAAAFTPGATSFCWVMPAGLRPQNVVIQPALITTTPSVILVGVFPNGNVGVYPSGTTSTPLFFGNLRYSIS